MINTLILILSLSISERYWSMSLKSVPLSHLVFFVWLVDTVHMLILQGLNILRACLCAAIIAKTSFKGKKKNSPLTTTKLKENRTDPRKASCSLYWISQRRNRLVVPQTANTRHREVVAEGGRGWSFIIFVSVVEGGVEAERGFHINWV